MRAGAPCGRGGSGSGDGAGGGPNTAARRPRGGAVDAALLPCCLPASSTGVGPLLRRPTNRGNGAAERYQERVMLYRHRGLQRPALELLC